MPKFHFLPILTSTLLFSAIAMAQPQPPSGIAAPKNALDAPPKDPADAKPSTKAEATLNESIAKVGKLQAVSADVEMKADLLDQQFILSGSYLKAPGNRVRLELTLSGLGDAGGRMLQVSDGSVLWDVQEVLKAASFQKTDVAKVMAKLEDPGVDAEQREMIRTSLGFAGPEALLEGLKKAIAFDQIEEGTFQDKPVWIIRGTWKDRSVLMGPDQTPLPATGPIPAYVPSVATLWLGKDDGWPYQVKMDGQVPSPMFRPDNRKLDETGKSIGARTARTEVRPSRLVLTYSNVKLNAEWKPEEFAFEPPRTAALAQQVQDMTPYYIAALDRYIQEKQRTEAIKGATKAAQAPADPALAPVPAPSPTTIPSAAPKG